MQETWNVLHTGFHDAAVNMALDEALLNWHSEGKIRPTLRFYGWSKPTLSVGRFQKVDKTIDFRGIERHHCQFVRRLTGGSAVLHDNELTYSIVVSESHPQIPKSITEAYYVLTKGLVDGYKNLGIEAEYFIPKEKSKNRTAVCFEKPAFYELIVDGKKISGNAQTRQKGVLMQHGSIPMSMDKDMLFDLFLYPSTKKREVNKRLFSQKATTINKITGKSYTYEEVQTAFYKGFQTGLNLKLEPMELTSSQWEEVYQLAKEKYENPLPALK